MQKAVKKEQLIPFKLNIIPLHSKILGKSLASQSPLPQQSIIDRFSFVQQRYFDFIGSLRLPVNISAVVDQFFDPAGICCIVSLIAECKWPITPQLHCRKKRCLTRSIF